jgi:hypothetical protein
VVGIRNKKKFREGNKVTEVINRIKAVVKNEETERI